MLLLRIENSWQHRKYLETANLHLVKGLLGDYYYDSEDLWQQAIANILQR